MISNNARNHDAYGQVNVAFIVGAIITLTACPPTPTNPSGEVVPNLGSIEYEQVGACSGYQQTSGQGNAGPINTVSVGPHQAYAIYRVKNIKINTSVLDLHFDPRRILVNSTPQARVDTNLALYTDLGVLAAVSVTVPKQQTMGINGLVVAVVHTDGVDGATDPQVMGYALQYENAPGEPPVVMSVVTPPRPWQGKDDCHTIGF